MHTMRATALGMTLDFAAPELKNENRATKYTDMFAYGKTVLYLEAHCEPGDQGSGFEMAKGQTTDVVKLLTSIEPKQRPSAKHTQLLPFFTILDNVCRKETKTCLFCECMGDDALKESSAGIECSEGHFHCGQCVAKLTMDLLKVENKGKCERLHGHIMCFKHPAECKATGFSERDLARHLPLDVFQDYLTARIKIAKDNMKAELEEHHKELLRIELERLSAMDERKRKVLIARKHIEEEILQMKCPRCRQAFYDFEGCFAISCSACPCKFCGWCFNDCGNGDASDEADRGNGRSGRRVEVAAIVF